MMTRRQAIKTSALAGATLALLPGALAQSPAPVSGAAPAAGPFTLPALPYAADALEPFIDARTMEIHHDKHHAAYVAGLNKAVAEFPELGKSSVEALLQDLSAVPEKARTAVRNHGGGHFNHSLFWQTLKKNGGEPTGKMAQAIEASFGSWSAFQEQFTKAALGQFGSGWAWLVLEDHQKLAIAATANQDSPLSQGRQPLFGIDVWEHAYYLKYQNRRPEYVAAFFHVINWDFVTHRYETLKA